MNLIKKLAVVVVLMLPMAANADLIVAQLGDDDGFGYGIVPDSPLDYSVFDYSDLQTGDGDGTDVWVLGTQTFTLTYDVSELGSVTSAFLEVFTVGQGYLGISSLYLDGLFVGQLTDGDIGSNPNNFARLDIFDVLAFSSSFNGSTSITINTIQDDGWVLDYLRLTINCEPFPGGGSTEGCFQGPGPFPAPEPSTFALFGIGLAAMGLTRRRKKQV